MSRHDDGKLVWACLGYEEAVVLDKRSAAPVIPDPLGTAAAILPP
ncbi:hypothetical protein ABZ342_31210 [Amycolatopsis sp. NPDC005961]